MGHSPKAPTTPIAPEHRCHLIDRIEDHTAYAALGCLRIAFVVQNGSAPTAQP